jgi:hypothetical protein
MELARRVRLVPLRILAVSLLCALTLVLCTLWIRPARHLAYATPCSFTQFTSPMYVLGGGAQAIEGPVGAHVTVEWSLCNAVAQFTLDLTTDKTCTTMSDAVALGTFSSDRPNSLSFVWPAAANTLGLWVACAVDATTHQLLAGPFNSFSSYYQVLAASPPSLSVSTSTAHPGDTITVTGSNWVPGNQNVQVSLGSCYPCGTAPLATAVAISSGNATGTFTASVAIPSSAPLGPYVIGAQTTGPVPGSLDTGSAGAVQIAIVTTLPPTQTPTPVPTQRPPSPPASSTATPVSAQATTTHTPVTIAGATPSVTAAALVLPGGGSGSNGDGSSASGGGSSGLLGALLVIAVLIVGCVGAGGFFLLRRRGEIWAPAGPDLPPVQNDAYGQQDPYRSPLRGDGQYGEGNRPSDGRAEHGQQSEYDDGWQGGRGPSDEYGYRQPGGYRAPGWPPSTGQRPHSGLD